jgi:hypothetical protein
VRTFSFGFLYGRFLRHATRRDNRSLSNHIDFSFPLFVFHKNSFHNGRTVNLVCCDWARILTAWKTRRSHYAGQSKSSAVILCSWRCGRRPGGFAGMQCEACKTSLWCTNAGGLTGNRPATTYSYAALYKDRFLARRLKSRVRYSISSVFVQDFSTVLHASCGLDWFR